MYHQIINFICILFISTSVSAQEPLTEVAQTQIKTLAEALLEQSNIPGLSISVSKNDAIVYSNGFGLADMKNNQQMTPDIRLRAASVSKVITATALGKLASDGALDFDAPIQQYVPYINEAYAQLTTRQLAGHTAGMAHRPKGSRYKKKQYDELRPTVELMKAPLLFEPDTKYQYSTHAYNLLAAIIEGASGETYANYMQHAIFDPLGMTDTFIENIKNLQQHDAKLYYIDGVKVKKERLTNASYKVPGAGFRTTPSDLVKMMKAYTSGFISKEVVAAMFASHHLKNGESTQVGIAWRSSIDAFNHPVIEHAGSWLGARSVIVHYPEENMNVSIMINASCNLLIEETAHLFAEVIRQNGRETSNTLNNLQEIVVTFNSPEGVEHYQGTITMTGNKGLIETNSTGFLKQSSLHYVSGKNKYALATTYGLLYMELTEASRLTGKAFIYFNRRTNHPTTDKPMVTFQ